MDRVRFWAPRLAGKYWGPIAAGLTVGEGMYSSVRPMVENWAVSKGLKRKRVQRDVIAPRLKQDKLRLPAIKGISNNKMPISSGASMRSRSRSRSGRSRRSRRVPMYVGRSAKPQIQTAGQYTGNFKFPNKRPRVSKDVYAKKGSRGNLELNQDAVTGASVCYFGMSSLPRDITGYKYLQAPAYHLAMSIFKRYMKKTYDVDVESHDQTIRDLNIWMDGTTTDGQRNPAELNLWYKEYPISTGSTGSTSHPVYAMGDTITLGLGDRIKNVVYNMALALSGSTYGAQGLVNGLVREFYGVSATDSIWYGTLPTPVKRPIMRMDTQYCRINVKNVLYVQNQTKGDSNDNTNIDTIDSNPIKGNIYYFKDPHPFVRHYFENTGTIGAPIYTGEYKLMADANGDGLILPDSEPGVSNPGGGALAVVDTSAWRQLPTPDMFNNLQKYCSVSLAPGEMKKFVLNFKFDGLVPAFIHGLHTHSVVAGGLGYTVKTGVEKKSLGSSVLFAFDKRLSTGLGPVEVAIQKHTYTSAMLTRRKNITTLPIATLEQAAITDDTTPNA